MTKYFLVNKKCELISECDYGSAEAAKAAIEKCNIPRGDVKAISFSINFLDNCYVPPKVHPEKYLKH